MSDLQPSVLMLSTLSYSWQLPSGGAAVRSIVCLINRIIKPFMDPSIIGEENQQINIGTLGYKITVWLFLVFFNRK